MLQAMTKDKRHSGTLHHESGNYLSDYPTP